MKTQENIWFNHKVIAAQIYICGCSRCDDCLPKEGIYGTTAAMVLILTEFDHKASLVQQQLC